MLVALLMVEPLDSVGLAEGNGLLEVVKEFGPDFASFSGGIGFVGFVFG